MQKVRIKLKNSLRITLSIINKNYIIILIGIPSGRIRLLMTAEINQPIMGLMHY